MYLSEFVVVMPLPRLGVIMCFLSYFFITAG